MQSERRLALPRHPYSGPSASGPQSTAFAFHLLSVKPRASSTHPSTILPIYPSSPLPPSPGCWTISCSWCGLVSRAEGDTMHNYVVRGHHAGNVSVRGRRVGIPVIPHPAECSVNKMEAHAVCEAGGRDPTPKIKRLLQRLWQEVLLRSWPQQSRYFLVTGF